MADREFIVVLWLDNVSVDRGELWREETMRKRLIREVES
jgi:hypothetical protein